MSIQLYSQKRVESWDDLSGTFNDLIQRPLHRFRWHRDILPRYIQGILSLHLHIAMDGHVLCCEVFGDRDTSGLRYRRGRDQRNGKFVEFGNGKQRHSMLIAVYEFVKPANGFIPSNIRLNRFNFISRSCGNSTVLKTIKTFTKPRHSGGIPNRKSRNFSISRIIDVEGRLVEVFPGQFKYDIVERCSDVREAIPDDSAQAERWRTEDLMRQHLKVAIGLTPDFVRLTLEIHEDFSPEGVEVLLSPDDFEFRSV